MRGVAVPRCRARRGTISERSPCPSHPSPSSAPSPPSSTPSIEAIERTEEVIAATERLRDALLHELLTRGLPGRHSEWADVPGLGNRAGVLGHRAAGGGGGCGDGPIAPRPSCNRSGEGTPLLNGPTEFGSMHPVPAQWTTSPLKMALAGDLLFCVRGATVGRTNWADSGYAIGRGLAAIRHRAGAEYQGFIGALVDFRLPRLLSAVAGSTFPNLSSSEIWNLPVGNPPLDRAASRRGSPRWRRRHDHVGARGAGRGYTRCRRRRRTHC